MRTQFWAIGLVILNTMIGSWGGVLLKLGADRISLSPRNIVTNGKILFGVVLFGLSSILFIIALRGGELTVLYPMVSLSYVWISLMSVYFLKEKMTRLKVFGISLIILGVVCIGLGNG